MSFKRAMHLFVIAIMAAVLLAGCGSTTTPTAGTTTTTVAATTAASGAASPSVAATVAPATVAATMMPMTPTMAMMTPTSMAMMTPTAMVMTPAATTGAGTGGAVSLVENVKMDANGKKGGQIVYTFAGQFPTSLMPYYISDNVAIIATHQVYAMLVGQSSNAKYYPYLVTQVPTLENGGVKINGNTMDVTVNLKPGLKWSDGSPLTSKDLIFTWKWATNPENTGFANDLFVWNLISDMTATNDTTVVIKFKQVFGPYLNFLNQFYPLPEKVWGAISLKDSGAEKSPQATKPTVTSGPMKVEDFVADDRVVLARNDNFSPVWGFNAYLDKVNFRFTPDSNGALAAISNSELDEAENLDDNQGAAAAKITNAKFDTAQQFSWEYLQFNLTNPLFQDKNVRRAIELAIDKEALIKQFRTLKTQALGVNFSPLSAFADKSIVSQKFSPDEAKKLLDAAGWVAGADGVRAKDGKKLTFVLSSTTAPVRKATAEVMLKYWKDVGIDAKFQPYSSTEFFGPWGSDGILARGRYDVGMFAQVGGIDNDGGFNNYYSKAIPTDENKGNGNNYGRISDPSIDKALDTQRGSVDQAVRAEAWKTFQKVIADNTYEVSLYTRVNNYILGNKVQNFKPNPTTDGNFWNVVELYLK